MNGTIAYIGCVWGLAIIACTMAGCDVFAPREPQTPVATGSTFEQPTSPSIVLRNLESSLLSANSSDYRRCFSDSARGLPPFQFIPSAQGLASAPAAFSGWNLDDEEQYLRNIFAELQPGQLASVSFSPADVTTPPIGDSVQFTATYSLRFPHTRPDVDQRAEGRLQFTFRQSTQSEWFITSWRDIVVENKTSWSIIKARFHDR